MHFKMSSAICFNLDLSKILFSGNGLRRDVVSEQWSLNAVKCCIQVVSDTGLTVQNCEMTCSLYWITQVH